MEHISVIVTVKNEALTIQKLLDSFERQTLLPNEVIVVDGGSNDDTLKILHQWKPKFRVLVIKKVGNRSVGRNEVIRQAKNELIAITDAGCYLDDNWLKYIAESLHSPKNDVVAGYYSADAHTPFEEAAAAYMLVMPDRIGKEFLPATRSMALQKSIWKKLGGFPEEYALNEDYVFAQRLKSSGATIAFQKKAVVYWKPPSTWNAFLHQVYKFAKGDTLAGIYRPKVSFLFLRYSILFIALGTYMPLAVLFASAYILWAVKENMRYLSQKRSLYILPIMQITTDFAVMIGSCIGLALRIQEKANQS